MAKAIRTASTSGFALLALLAGATSAQAAQSLIFNTAGVPQTPGFNGDGDPLKSELNLPMGIAIASNGLLIADSANNRVRLLTGSQPGIVTVAGTGTPGYNGDNIPATQAQLQNPVGVAPGPAPGSFYIADQQNQRIRFVSASGTITTVAGTGAGAFNGDNQPATSADLSLPSAVEPFNGGFLISDSGNNRIRFVSSAGIITTVAGTGTPGYNGDNQPATSAQLNFPAGLGAVATGFYFADGLNSRVRVVTNSNGLIATVAGTGNPIYNGDNIPATSANVGPTDVEATDQGLLIVDQQNDRLRFVSPAGTISTLAGTGVAGYNGTGGTIPALSAELNNPFGVDQYPAGAMVISDQNNALVRTIAQPPPKACGKRNFNYVSGTKASDRLLGTRRADLIIGLGGRDRIAGLGGKDCLVGGAAADSLKGGRGGDVLVGGKGRDRIRCGKGRDLALVTRRDRSPRGCERLR